MCPPYATVIYHCWTSVADTPVPTLKDTHTMAVVFLTNSKGRRNEIRIIWVTSIKVSEETILPCNAKKNGLFRIIPDCCRLSIVEQNRVGIFQQETISNKKLFQKEKYCFVSGMVRTGEKIRYCNLWATRSVMYISLHLWKSIKMWTQTLWPVRGLSRKINH